MEMFSKIREHLELNNSLVCVLIDEIESLTHARSSCMNGAEPSDSIRVVNAILTQIDQIRKYVSFHKQCGYDLDISYVNPS